MRKNIATASQLLALKEVEADWTARHLGHAIRVHRNFNRLHESTTISSSFDMQQNQPIPKVNVSDVEVDELARHLGHAITVHRDFYRLHESTTISSSFDMQQNRPIPKVNVSDAFYMCQVWLYNLPIVR